MSHTVVVELAGPCDACPAPAANPLRVWSAFVALSLFALAGWSRDWLGWWCLVPVAAVILLLVANPLLSARPATTRTWASKALFGQRVFSRRAVVPIPAQFRGPATAVAGIATSLGVALLVHGVVVLHPATLLGGLVLAGTALAWHLDRMVLLYEGLKWTATEYATWEY